MTTFPGSRYRSAMAVARRLLHIAALLVLLSWVAFALVHELPGTAAEPAELAGSELTRDRVERVRALRGLDRSLGERYACWLVGRSAPTCAWWPGGQGVLSGDLGMSRVHGRPVTELLRERLVRTASIMGPAFVLAAMASLGLGALAAAHRGRGLDRAISGLGILGVSVPLHWVALLAVFVVGLELGWLPTSGVEDPANPGPLSRVEHALLPVLVTATFFAGRWLRYVRAAVAEALGAPFVQALRARGIPERRVMAHALRSALPPVLTVMGHSLPALFSGSLVIERVFAYPGMGALLLESVMADDHLVAVVVLLGFALSTLLAALVVDLSAWLLDPRLRAADGAQLG